MSLDRALELFEGNDVAGARALLRTLVVEPGSEQDADREELLGRIATTESRNADAVQHLERALAIRMELHGKTSSKTARGHGALARHYAYTGEHELGLRAAKLAVKRSDAEAAWLLLQGDLERDSLDAAAAEKTYTAALKKLRGAARIPALRGLGNVYLARGNGTQARKRFTQALEHLDDAESYEGGLIEAGLGQAATTTGDGEEAVEHFERALQRFIASVGEDSWDTSVCLNNLGLAAAQHDTWLAAAAAQYAIAIDEKNGRTKHPFHATTLNNLAFYCSELGRPASAIAYAERALALIELSRPAWHLDVAITLSNLANYHRESGRDDLALGRARQLASTAAQLVATDQEAAAGILFSTGTLLLELGRDPAAASTLYGEALAMRERLREDVDDDVRATAYNAVARLFVAGEIEHAIAILEGVKSRWTDEDDLEIVDETIQAIREGDRDTVLQGTELEPDDEDE